MDPNPPRRRRPRRTPPALWALAGSVVLHAAAIGLLLALGALDLFTRPPSPLKPRPLQAVDVRPLAPEEWARNRTPASPEQAAPKKRAERTPEEKEPEPIPEGQVVATAPGNEKASPDAKYLAESSNSVQKETRARHQTPLYRNAAPKQTSPVPQEEAGADDDVEVAQTEGNDGEGDDARPPADADQKRLAVEIPDIQARDAVRLEDPAPVGEGPKVANRTESLALKGNSERLRLRPGDPSAAEDASLGRKGTPGLVTLTPSLSVLGSVYGGAPNDHLDDVDEGDGTFLNTREWKYASFFNRVKQSIGMTWDPGRELRRRDPSGSIYSGRDRYTLLKVTLDQQGRVKDVWVEKSCGLDFLDLEAMRAFERAQPFPNPPSGMMGSEATLTFNFGFFVELGRGPRIQLFR